MSAEGEYIRYKVAGIIPISIPATIPSENFVTIRIPVCTIYSFEKADGDQPFIAKLVGTKCTVI
jgi:hypothetical protein